MRRGACANIALLTVAALGLVITVVSCSGPSQASLADKANVSGCIDATPTGEDIAKGGTWPIQPVETEAVKSNTADVYYIAMRFSDDAGTAQGVWFTRGLDDPDHSAPPTIFSIDPVAQKVTTWPGPGNDSANFAYPSDQTRAVEACLS